VVRVLCKFEMNNNFPARPVSASERQRKLNIDFYCWLRDFFSECDFPSELQFIDIQAIMLKAEEYAITSDLLIRKLMENIFSVENQRESGIAILVCLHVVGR
jgi:hypothetical protein